jgi:hypothetical protein
MNTKNTGSVSNVCDLPITFADVERRRDRRQALRLRISRRARELAERHEEIYFKAILFQIYRGTLAEDLIPYWEPIDGGVGAPNGREA